MIQDTTTSIQWNEFDSQIVHELQCPDSSKVFWHRSEPRWDNQQGWVRYLMGTCHTCYSVIDELETDVKPKSPHASTGGRPKRRGTRPNSTG